MKRDQMRVGDSTTLTKTITEDEVCRFAELTGDNNPVHMDETYCREHGLHTRVVHGMLVLSYLSALIGMQLPGEGAVWMSQSIDFLAPVRLGDTVDIAAVVTHISDANALKVEIITMKIKIKNQRGQLIAKGSVKVTIK